MNRAQIELENVFFSYNNTNTLNDVNFKVNSGDIVSIIGPNGGGKSTLLKLILGLIVPDSGTIKINGNPPKTERGNLGYVPQSIKYDSRFPITVFETVLSGRLKKKIGFFSRKDKEKTLDELKRAGLSEAADTPFSELSGGQKQKVLIARALAGDPEILLLDEPTTNIDTNSEEQLTDLLLKLRKRLTILLVSHDMGFVNTFSGRVFCVNKKVAEHPCEDVDCALINLTYGKKISRVRHDITLDSCPELKK